MTENPRVFGADYSVYVRIVRVYLIEKGVEYELLPIDVFAKEGPPPGLVRQNRDRCIMVCVWRDKSEFQVRIRP
jgi:hypothetical protein